jgi:predicted deacylase
MDLQSNTICGQRDGPRLLILAGVHGDEFEPMVAAKRLQRKIRGKMLKGQVTVVPVLNQSARLRKQRVGEDGLDLARTFPGRENGTVTESVAFAATRLIQGADYLIDMHTGGTRLRLWPLAGYLLHDNRDILAQQREMARAFNLPVVWGTDPALDGRTLSAARDANVPAIYVEYLGAAPFCREAVRALTDGCLNTMALLGMIDRLPPANQVRYLAEDARAGSGHLQRCHLAPHAGVFEAIVELGQQVEQGQVLGRLRDAHGMRPAEILAEQPGRIVCLSASISVAEGDGVAVIVEFQRV